MKFTRTCCFQYEGVDDYAHCNKRVYRFKELENFKNRENAFTKENYFSL